LERDIIGSVGDTKKGAGNRDDDVKTVQGLLNVQIVADRRRDSFISVDGRIDSVTLGAIVEFQRRHSLAQTDLIKRGDATIQALARFREPSGMRASGNLFDFLKAKGMEGYSLVLYEHDGGHNTSIGVGHFVHPGGLDPSNPKEAKFKNGLTASQVEQLFRDDERDPEREVCSRVLVPLTQNQFDALVSFAFNLHWGEFASSTLLRMLNQGDYDGAAKQFQYWLRSGKGHPPGLHHRRDQETALFGQR
jgi:lysozyme